MRHSQEGETARRPAYRYTGGVPTRPAPAEPRPASRALPHAQAVVHALFGPPRERAFDVRYWEGTVEAAPADRARYTLVVARPGALRRMLLPPSEMAVIEAYLSGDLDVEGDLAPALTLGDAVGARLRSPRTLAGLARHLLALPRDDDATPVAHLRAARAERTVRRVGRRHERARDRAAVSYHYDVGNEFYALWLDRRMVYSCAYFHAPSDAIDDAQEAKLDLVCRKLRLKPGDRFLDVGCGWGALVIHAAQRYGATALGITLSEAQASLARERIAAAGLADRCAVELRDYRDLAGTFDRVASVGMVEHVGEARLPEYFASVHRVLAPGGLFLNHGIVSPRAAAPPPLRERLERRLWRRDEFIDRYVFPDSDLVPVHAMLRAAEDAGFEVRDVESLREHYALTLAAWTRRLEASAGEAIAATSERTYRTWLLYMTGARRAFTRGTMSVVQTLLARPTAEGRAEVPLTREDLLVR